MEESLESDFIHMLIYIGSELNIQRTRGWAGYPISYCLCLKAEHDPFDQHDGRTRTRLHQVIIDRCLPSVLSIYTLLTWNGDSFPFAHLP
jgi:hypothetical protein